MTKKILLVFQMLFLSSFIFGAKVAVLPGINHPYGFRVDGDRFYVTEGVTIFIYSTKDYQLKKKFGKEGEGPGEILLDRRRGNDEIGISIRPDYLIVNSIFKVLYFTKQGEYVKEIRIAESGGRLVEPLGVLGRPASQHGHVVGSPYHRQRRSPTRAFRRQSPQGTPGRRYHPHHPRAETFSAPLR